MPQTELTERRPGEHELFERREHFLGLEAFSPRQPRALTMPRPIITARYDWDRSLPKPVVMPDIHAAASPPIATHWTRDHAIATHSLAQARSKRILESSRRRMPDSRVEAATPRFAAKSAAEASRLKAIADVDAAAIKAKAEAEAASTKRIKEKAEAKAREEAEARARAEAVAEAARAKAAAEAAEEQAARAKAQAESDAAAAKKAKEIAEAEARELAEALRVKTKAVAGVEEPLEDEAEVEAATVSNVPVQRQPSVGTLLKPADRTRPPGRVRYAFKQMDVNSSGGLTLEELKAGLAREFGVDELAPHVLEAMEYQFLVHADDREDGVKVLTAKVFSRYFCEVLFRHFDKNNNGVLELAEVHEALKFLVKPDEDGNQLVPVVAFPPEFCDEDGEVKLPITWFWECARVRHRTCGLHFRAPCSVRIPCQQRAAQHAPCGCVPERPPALSTTGSTLRWNETSARRIYQLSS